MLWQNIVWINQRCEDDSRNSTFRFFPELDSDTAVSDTISGDTGVCVVQVLLCHLFYDGYLRDLELLKVFSVRSGSGKEFQIPWILTKLSMQAKLKHHFYIFGFYNILTRQYCYWKMEDITFWYFWHWEKDLRFPLHLWSHILHVAIVIHVPLHLWWKRFLKGKIYPTCQSVRLTLSENKTWSLKSHPKSWVNAYNCFYSSTGEFEQRTRNQEYLDVCINITFLGWS